MATDRLGRAWSAAWPPVAAAALLIGAWQAVAWLRLKPEYILPGPLPVFGRLGEALREPDFWSALATTAVRAAGGFSVALVIGLGLGLAVSRSARLRTAVGSLISGLQSMPSIAWFPLAILLFGLT